MSKPRPRRPLAPPEESACLLVRLAPEDVAVFRFLLEARDNLAGFTVLDRREALLKVFFSPHQRVEVLKALEEMGTLVKLAVKAWPGGSAAVGGTHDAKRDLSAC